MNGGDERDKYIKLKDLELEHPYTERIPLTRGRLVFSEDEYVFSITWDIYKKLERVRGDYLFEFQYGEYPCSIVDLYFIPPQIELFQSSETAV